MIYLINIAIAAVLSFLSLSFFPYFKIFGVVPLFVIYFIVALTYFRRGFEPFAMAAFVGIFFDIFSPNPFGFYLTIFLLAAGIVRYIFPEGMNRLSFWYYGGVCLGIVLIYLLAQYGILYMEGVRFEIINFWPLMLSLLVHAFFVIIFYVALEHLFDWEKSLESKLKRR